MTNKEQSPIRILIVDDEERLLRVLRLGLKPKGFDVLTAPNAEQAIDYILSKPLDIILTDIRLGKMSGIDLVYELERLNVKLPIIVMTAFADVETAVKAFRHGAHDYIQKPFTVEELDELIRKIIKKSLTEKNETSLVQSLDEGISEAEKELIIKALENAGHVKAKAAKLLKISERTLWYKLKKYNLQ